MMKQFFFLLAAGATITSCYKPQNRNISVSGQVTDARHRGVENVTIFINRGVNEGNLWPVAHKKYDSVLTNSEGKYSYLITDYRASYEVCCKIPPGFSTVDTFCQKVDQSIKDGKTMKNVLNFKIGP